MVTCRLCKEKLAKDKAKLVGKNSYYHPECLEIKQKEEEEKKREANEYKELIEYICKLYGLDAPTGMILKQIKDMREEYGYKLSGMKLALQYFYEIENNDIIEDGGIGIIPYVYEKAKKQYITKLNVQKSLEDYENDEAEEVVIDLHRKPKLNKQFIDISSL